MRSERTPRISRRLRRNADYRSAIREQLSHFSFQSQQNQVQLLEWFENGILSKVNTISLQHQFSANVFIYIIISSHLRFFRTQTCYVIAISKGSKKFQG